MKRLTLMRHGDARWKDAGLSDLERPLNRRGVGAAERTAVGVGRRSVLNMEHRRIDLPGARVTRERHRRIASAVVGALAGDDPAVGLAGRLAGELHGMLVGGGAAEVPAEALWRQLI